MAHLPIDSQQRRGLGMRMHTTRDASPKDLRSAVRKGLATTCLVVLLLSQAVGCSSTATFVSSKPAETPVMGWGRVAVTNFGGSDDSRIVEQTVTEELAKSGLVQLVDASQLQRYSSIPLYREDGRLKRDVALRAARKMGVETLLVGQLHHLEPDGTTWGTKAFRFGDPSVLAVVQYELLDVRTGSAIVDGRAESSTFKGELDTSGETYEREVLERLTQEAANAMAQQLVPHEVDVDVVLGAPGFGKGSGNIKAGNKAAGKGDWQTAMQNWQEALRENPDSHVALYNMSLACEAMKDYAGAERHLNDALARSDRSTYRVALERIRLSATEHQTVLAQRSSVAPSGSPQLVRLPPVTPDPPPQFARTPWNPNMAATQASYAPPSAPVRPPFQGPPAAHAQQYDRSFDSRR